MPKITREHIIKLAKLSRLSLSDQEIERFMQELNEIFVYIERLDRVDTTGLDPTYQVSGLVNQTRADVVNNEQVASAEELLSLSPQKEGRYIKVKRMI